METTTKASPTPWIASTYMATDTFRAINEHEALCDENGRLLALFGPKGHPQSIIDRDMVGRAVNSYDALVDFVHTVSVTAHPKWRKAALKVLAIALAEGAKP